MTPIFAVILGIVFVFAITALTGAPYVPSFKSELKIAFKELYPLSDKDFIVDLGSGDGVVLKVASSFGASGVGYEINPFLVFISRIRLRRHKKFSVREENLFKAHFPDDTTIVYIFGEARDIKKMANHVQHEANRLNKKLYIISHGFQIPDMKPEKNVRAYFLYKISPKAKD